MPHSTTTMIKLPYSSQMPDKVIRLILRGFFMLYSFAPAYARNTGLSQDRPYHYTTRQ